MLNCKVGQVITFDYEGKERCVKIEKIKTYHSPLLGTVQDVITGWDYTAAPPVGAYRSFKVSKMIA